VTRRQLPLFLVFFFCGLFARATHDVGGSLAYEFKGDPDGDGLFTYDIILTTYQNCNSIFWWTTGNGSFPLSSQDVGIYEGSDTASNISLISTVNLTLATADSNRITIGLPSGCPAPPAGVCVYEVVYRGSIDLPITTTGYHFIFDKCCRNVLTNISSPQPPSSGTGVIYYAWTSGPLSGNSSPIFTDLSVPFICRGDTTPILNTAVDPDGDQLLFSFEHPYDGNAVNSGTPQPASYSWPPTLVNYLPGFNVNQPFGSTGYSFVNAFTGYTEYYSPNTGEYGVTVQIKELNGNGDLVGLSRRHYQFQVLSGCQPNTRPKLSTIGSSGQTVHSVEEGDTLCFDITFSDPDGDSLNFSTNITGTIFNSSVTNPAATTTPFTFTASTATSEFCWNTGCGQGRSLPYQFTASVSDDGCFPKSVSEVYQITVEEFAGPDEILGPINTCSGEIATYETDSLPGATYSWTIVGGTQLSGGNGHIITVEWGNNTGGSVVVSANSQFGCPSDPLSKSVTIRTIQFDAGNDTTICLGDTIALGGSPTAPPFTSVKWSPSADLNFDTVFNPLAFPTTTTTYNLQVQDTLGCQVVDSVTVTIATNPNASAGNDTTICLGDLINLNASGGTSYAWSPGTGLSSTSVPNPQVNISATQTYVVTITDASPCPTVDSVTVTIFNPALVDAGNDTAVCLGKSVVLGGNPTGQVGATFLWTPSTDLNFDTIANPVFSTTSPGTYVYTVAVRAGNGCFSRDSLEVTINPLPNVQILAGRTTICEDDTTLLRGTGATSYEWIPFGSLSDSVGTPVIASPLDTTTYVLLGADANSCEATDTLTVNVDSKPIIETDSILFLCRNDTLELDATLGVGINYAWTSSPAVSFISSSNIRNPQVSHAIAGDTVQFFLLGNRTTVANCSNRDTAIMIVDSIVPTSAGPDTFVCSPGSVLIGGNPTGFAGTQFAWTNFFLDDSTLANPTASPTVNFTYVVNTTNGSCAGVDSVRVMVRPRPDISVSPSESSFCVGESVVLTGTLGSGTLASISWFPSDSLSSPNSLITTASPDDTTLYTLLVEDTNGCTDLDTALVNVFTSPSINIFDTLICEGDSVQYTNDPIYTYSWSPNTDIDDVSSFEPYVFPGTTRQYLVEVSNGLGCFGRDSATVTVIPQPNLNLTNDTTICFGDRIRLNASGGTSILWTPFTGISNPTAFDPFASPTVTTTYTATISNGQCDASGDVTISVNPIPNIQAGPDLTVCEGGFVQLSASGGLTYNWTPGAFLDDSTSGTPVASVPGRTGFLVRGFDALGCSSSDSVYVDVNPLPFADAGPDIVVCSAGAFAQIGGSPTAAPGNLTNWTNGTFLDDPSSPNPTALVSSPLTFVLQVTDSNSCQNLDTVEVDYFRIGLRPSPDLCLGESDTLEFTELVATEPIAFSWSPSTGLDSTTLQEPTATPPFPIVYKVVVQDSSGCRDSAEVDINILPAPLASFDGVVRADCDEASVELENTTATYDSLIWSFQNQTSSEEFFQFMIPYSSNASVQLIAYTGTCSDTVVQDYSAGGLQSFLGFEPPNVITPNGDGINDYFEVSKGNRFFDCTEVQIFDRWGVEIFRSAGTSHIWDGTTFSGKEVSEGVYFYVVTLGRNLFNGHITVIR
jgi:gliding motility-associated-like protein